jgi:hypothetical protein
MSLILEGEQVDQVKPRQSALEIAGLGSGIKLGEFAGSVNAVWGAAYQL